MVPEQRYLAAAQPPEIPPGEIKMRWSWSVHVIEEDFLGALELPHIARLVGQSQLSGVEVPVCERLTVAQETAADRSHESGGRPVGFSFSKPLVVASSQEFDQAMPPAAPCR